ncbi:MAG: hypothetical protein WD768_06250 [Phycisphaeraceae bacterium]
MRNSVSSAITDHSTHRTLLTARLVLLFTAATILTGCATDEAYRYYATETYPAKDAREVELLSEPPSRPHEVIADFQARGASASYMRKRAAEIGADAVIVVTLGGYRSPHEKWASDDSHSTSYTRITATAIRYKEGP